jgi:hypothetical protein
MGIDRKSLIDKRFIPLIISVLNWNKVNNANLSSLALFKTIVMFITMNTEEMQNHIGTVVIENGDYNDYFIVVDDVKQNINEYRCLLISTIDTIIKDFSEFKCLWENKDKYIILV